MNKFVQMNNFTQWILRSAACLLLAVCVVSVTSYSTQALAQNSEHCSGTATELTHSYPSGAQWLVCADLNANFGLHLTNLRYQTPNDSPRETFSELHLAGVLEHYHNQPEERSVLSEPGFGTTRSLNFNNTTCPGELFSVGDQQNNLCTISYANKILAKFDNTSVVQNHSWDLITAVSDGQDVWEVIVTFSEEGSITPTLNRSGEVHRFTTDARFGNATPWNDTGNYAVNSTVFATWRMVPAFTEPGSSHTVEQLDFMLRPDLGDRRPMRSETLSTETFRQVNREQFRTWRVYGSDGAGYAIDVQNSGFQYRSRRYNFALFNFAVTAWNACEQIILDENPIEGCGMSLDDYVSGESLAVHRPVLWLSQSMPIVIGSEDQPLMQTRSLSFVLTPFDWTEASPFAPIGDGS